MSQNLDDQIFTDPLTVGNVVSAGLRLYRDRFKQYLALSTQVTLWALLPILGVIPMAMFVYTQNSSVYIISIPIILGLAIYGLGNSSIHSALIARLAYQELINQPETVQEGRRHLQPQFWKFVRMILIISLIVLGILIVSYLGLIILGVLLAGIGISLGANANNLLSILFLGLLSLGLTLGLFLVILRFWLRFFITEIPLSIEENTTALGAIGRSWTLTKGYVSRILSIITVAFLITLPILIILQTISFFINRIILGLININLGETEPMTPWEDQIKIIIIAYVSASLIGLLGNIFILPFWQAIKGVIYYDLRSRREGLGLKLRESDS